MGRVTRKQLPIPSSRYAYRNKAQIAARFIKRPPKGVPACDTIRFTMFKPRSRSSFHMWMRPDEAAAAVAVLGHALWAAEVAAYIKQGGT